MQNGNTDAAGLGPRSLGSVRFILLAITLACCATLSQGDVRLPAILSDNMVVEANAPIAIWGRARAGEAVTVSLAGQTQHTAADATGRWKVTLSPITPGGPLEMTVAGDNRRVVHNILVGAAWLCAGQSNMQFQMKNWNLVNDKNEIAEANWPMIRMFKVKWCLTDVPQEDCQGSWQVCTPANVETFSAVGYFFGRELHVATGLAVGLINTGWGATPAEAWVRHDVLGAQEEYRQSVADLDARFADSAATFYRQHGAEIRQWLAMADEANQQGKAPPLMPVAPMMFEGDPRYFRPMSNYGHGPTLVYNTMISPLLNYRLAGVLWYQGESNTNRAGLYRRLLTLMIENWRKDFNRDDLPFLIVQLPNLGLTSDDKVNAGGGWATVREAQRLVARDVPHTALAVTIDVGGDLHPPNKQAVGVRLALLAEGMLHGRNKECCGPLYDSMRVEGSAIRVRFKHVGGGLTIKDPAGPGRSPSTSSGPAALTGFAIAGADDKFVQATAEIDGDSVIIQAPGIDKPTRVHYAFGTNPPCNLFNKEGLPASPFCTESE